MIFLPIIFVDKSCLTVGLICDTHCEVSSSEKDVLPLGVLKIYPDKIIYEEYDVDSNDLLFSEEFEVTTTFGEGMNTLNTGSGAGFGVVIGVAIVGLAIILMAVKKVNLGFSVQQSG